VHDSAHGRSRSSINKSCFLLLFVMCRTLGILFCAIEVAVAIVGCDVGTSVVPAAGCGGTVPSSNTRYQTTCPGVCVSTRMLIVGGFHLLTRFVLLAPKRTLQLTTAIVQQPTAFPACTITSTMSSCQPMMTGPECNLAVSRGCKEFEAHTVTPVTSCTGSCQGGGTPAPTPAGYNPIKCNIHSADTDSGCTAADSVSISMLIFGGFIC
jgi:hypothetical protein